MWLGSLCYNELLLGKILGILTWLGVSWVDSRVFSSSYKSLPGQFTLSITSCLTLALFCECITLSMPGEAYFTVPERGFGSDPVLI